MKGILQGGMFVSDRMFCGHSAIESITSAANITPLCDCVYRLTGTLSGKIHWFNLFTKLLLEPTTSQLQIISVK